MNLLSDLLVTISFRKKKVNFGLWSNFVYCRSIYPHLSTPYHYLLPLGKKRSLKKKIYSSG